MGDVAKRVEVSIGTVSAVLNEKNTVKQETRKNVLNAIKELNYRPHGSARNLKNTDTFADSIGLLIRELDNPFYTAIALGVMEYARNKGYLVVIASSEGDHTYEEKITHSFSGKDIKGAIIAPVLEGTTEIEHLFRLRMVNFPFVLLENVKGIQANVVSINNSKAMIESVKYLMDNGHSNIIHFAGPTYASHTFERIDGFRRAFSESHFAFHNDMIISAGAHTNEGYRTCMEYFRNRDRAHFPTAIVCYNDLVALGVMAALNEMNIKIPDEISIVGNDDISFSKYVPVQLTTVHAPMFELGRKAAEILINNIESPKPMPIENIMLDSEFIIRQSTKALRSVHANQLQGELSNIEIG
jgi:LacI family transcriptional regulator